MAGNRAARQDVAVTHGGLGQLGNGPGALAPAAAAEAKHAGGPGIAGWVWTLKRALVNLRWPGLTGLALLVFAAVFYALGVQPLHGRVAALRAEAKELSSRLGSAGRSAEPPTRRSQLANFYAFFPVTSRVPVLLGQLEHAAKKNDLRLDKGEYRFIAERDFPVARYQVTLPVRGSYPQVRGFVNDVLDDVPSAVLEDLSLKREAIGSPEVEATVRFGLYLGMQ